MDMKVLLVCCAVPNCKLYCELTGDAFKHDANLHVA